MLTKEIKRLINGVKKKSAYTFLWAGERAEVQR